MLKLLKAIVYNFSHDSILFILKLNNINDLYKEKYQLFDFPSPPALDSHKHYNNYLSKSHCLLTRCEGCLDTLMTVLDSFDNI